jgi:energy-converting hydrogenase Eha subunit A
MSSSPTTTTTRAGQPWRTWVRALVLILGVVASAAAGYAAAVAVMIVAVVLDAAPLLAGETTQQQAWVSPAAASAGAIAFGLGIWVSVRIVRRHPSP